MTYYEKEELRKEISLLRSLLTMEIGRPISRQQRLKSVESFKKSIREKIRHYNGDTDFECHYSEDGESCWYKQFYDEPFTEEEKKEFIEENWVHIYSLYDCTGKWFTRYIVVCNVNTSFGAKSVVYHALGLDV